MTVTDDAGTPIRILNPAGVADWPMAGDPRIDALAIRMRATQSLSSIQNMMLGSVLVLVFAAGVLVLPRLLPGWPQWAYMLTLMGAIMAVNPVYSRLRIAMAAQSLMRLLIEEGICPSCGYNLHGLDKDDRGHIRCPECSAQWRADRIRRVEPFAPSARLVDAHTVVALGAANTVWVGTDDRGTRCPRVSPHLRRPLAESADPGHRARLLDARAEIACSGRILRWLAALLMIGSAIGLGIMFIIGGNISAGSIVGVALVLGLFAGIGIWALFGNFCYNPRQVRFAMIKRSLCPSCAHDLSAAACEEDGCTVCPGCLRAWRMDRPGGPPPGGG